MDVIFTQPSSQLKHVIRNLWHKLTDAEIDILDEQRDTFFMAVRKKHGLARAQAELFLHELEHEFQNRV